MRARVGQGRDPRMVVTGIPVSVPTGIVRDSVWAYTTRTAVNNRTGSLTMLYMINCYKETIWADLKS